MRGKEMAKATDKKKNDSQKTAASKKKQIRQGELPQVGLEPAAKIAHAIWDNYAGDPTAPHDVAIALGVSPTSSSWRQLTGASVAYGLTVGGYNAETIGLTDLGRSIVAPQSEGEDVAALARAALSPSIPSEFYKKYNRAKWPKQNIAANVLVGMGVLKEKSDEAVALIERNAELVGFLRETKTGPFLSIDNPIPQIRIEVDHDNEADEIQDDFEASDTEALNAAGLIEERGLPEPRSRAEKKPNNRVFITHGKDTSTMEQIKQVVELGGFIPVVSMQRETAAKAVPDKVMDDMRSCDAAIIHVSGEAKITDVEGVTHTHLNPNVLIEIGAAMALYYNRFILVVEEGLEIPSNLQGLYQSRYSGKELTFEAGMKILKALRGLKETDS